MPLLSQYAQKKKIEHFLNRIQKEARILEIGCGDGWLGDYLKSNGHTGYLSIDIAAKADITGDICNWKNIDLLDEASFDVIIAFEVVEHVDCFQACCDLLKSEGRLMMTTPIPHMDWVMKALECLGLNQKRTSPHDHLVYFKDVKWSGNKDVKIVGFLSQWGIFTKE